LRRLLVITLFSLLVWARPASGTGTTTVATVWPANPSAEVTEALTRLHGELLSVGLNVARTGRPASRVEGADSRVWLEQVANERGASAVIDVVGDDGLVAIDVWVVKKEPGRFEVTRVAVEPNSDNPAERIALRAMDALRGSLLEIDWAGREKPIEPVPLPAPPPPLPVPPEEPQGPSFDLEAGAAVLTSLDGVGPAFMPLVRAGWAVRPWLLLQASMAGLGTRPEVETADGRVRVTQQFATLGAAFRWRHDKTLWPFVSLSAGALHTSLAGQSDVGTQGHDLGQWSALLDGGAGMGVQLSRRFFATFAAHLQIAQPYVAVHILDAVAATSGRPNLLFTLTLGAWL
jgi:hypothetical protein